MYSSDSTSSVAAEASSKLVIAQKRIALIYVDSGDDLAPIAPYQFEPIPRTELLDS